VAPSSRANRYSRNPSPSEYEKNFKSKQLRTEISMYKKENEEYRRLVDLARKKDRRENKRKKEAQENNPESEQ
jgi:hypothetical protein